MIDRSFPMMMLQTTQSMSTTSQIRIGHDTHRWWIPEWKLQNVEFNAAHNNDEIKLNSFYCVFHSPLSIHGRMIATLWPIQGLFYQLFPMVQHQNRDQPALWEQSTLLPSLCYCRLCSRWYCWQIDQSSCSHPTFCTLRQSTSTSKLAQYIAASPRINSKILMQSKMDI